MFGLVRQPPARGWAYWMLSDAKQRSMVRTLDNATAPTAATAAPTATESATPTTDLALTAAISAHATATTTIACSSK